MCLSDPGNVEVGSHVEDIQTLNRQLCSYTKPMGVVLTVIFTCTLKYRAVQSITCEHVAVLRSFGPLLPTLALDKIAAILHHQSVTSKSRVG